MLLFMSISIVSATAAALNSLYNGVIDLLLTYLFNLKTTAPPLLTLVQPAVYFKKSMFQSYRTTRRPSAGSWNPAEALGKSTSKLNSLSCKTLRRSPETETFRPLRRARLLPELEAAGNDGASEVFLQAWRGVMGPPVTTVYLPGQLMSLQCVITLTRHSLCVCVCACVLESERERAVCVCRSSPLDKETKPLLHSPTKPS